MINILRFIKIVLLILATFTMRPTFLGQEYASLSIFLCVLALAIHALESTKTKEAYITKKNLILLVSLLILWSYFLVHSAIVGANNLFEVLSVATSVISVVFAFSIILSQEKNNYLYFRWLIKVLGFLSFSFTITLLLSFFVDIRQLYLFEVPIKYYNHSALFYFPFTSLSSFMVVGGHEYPRFLGMFREPGILQAFLIWAYFNLKQYQLDTRKMKAFLIIGIFGTLSTAGIAIFFGTIALKLMLNKKIFRGILLIVVCVLAFYYAPVIGLQEKQYTHGASLDIRSIETISGLEKLLENPMGTGIYNKGEFASDYSGINLLAASYMLGAIGFIAVLIVYFVPLFGYPYKIPYLVGIAPIIITLLYSQPIFDTPLVYIMLLANYNLQFMATEPKKESKKVFKKWKFKKYRLTW